MGNGKIGIGRTVFIIGVLLMAAGLTIAVGIFHEQGMLVTVKGRVADIGSCHMVEFTVDGRVYRDTAYSAKGMSGEEFETMQIGDRADFYAYRHHGEHYHLTEPMSYFSSYLPAVIFIVTAALMMLISNAGNRRKA